jgi:hypothetical protein
MKIKNKRITQIKPKYSNKNPNITMAPTSSDGKAGKEKATRSAAGQKAGSGPSTTQASSAARHVGGETSQ